MVAGAAACAAVALTAGSAGASGGAGVAHIAPATAAPGAATVPSHPATITVPASNQGAPKPGSPALPTWAGSFTDGGSTYPFKMVGTPPTKAGSTTVATSITPIKFVLANGAYAYPGSAVTEMKQSALFVNAKLRTATTQYGDDVQRAEFYSSLNPNYHVKLASPSIKPMVTIDVPAADGSVIHASDGVGYLAISDSWFTAKVNSLAAKAPANTLPMFLAYETYLYTQSPSSAGIGGFHSAVITSTGQHTYAYASWVTSDMFGAASANLAAMSHEVAEWLNDPFVNNKVPAWSVPSEPQYGCSSYLEVGDPLVGHVTTIGGLNFQDVAGFSWFARLTPSIGFDGEYSWLGTFTSPATGC